MHLIELLAALSTAQPVNRPLQSMEGWVQWDMWFLIGMLVVVFERLISGGMVEGSRYYIDRSGGVFRGGPVG